MDFPTQIISNAMIIFPHIAEHHIKALGKAVPKINIFPDEIFDVAVSIEVAKSDTGSQTAKAYLTASTDGKPAERKLLMQSASTHSSLEIVDLILSLIHI